MQKLWLVITLALMTACGKPDSEKQKVDLLLYNARVYTVDKEFTVTEAIAVDKGRIVATGTDDDMRDNYLGAANLDLKGKPVYPGFIDAHCHFYGYGKSLREVDLVGTASYAEVIERIKEHHKKYPSEWITGRGWDQNDWEIKEFPDRQPLDDAFPTTPVFVRRVDGHAALVNAAAIKRAGLHARTRVSGGEVEVVNGRMTGILVDNAIGLITAVVPGLNSEEIRQALLDAQKNCFAVGLTTVDDAGLAGSVIDIIDAMHKDNSLKMRVYAMANPSPANKERFLKSGPYKTDRLNVRSFKIYADGALGSRGACLLQPYSDKPESSGFLLNAKEYYRQTALELYKHGFQMNTHAIGDSANRHVLHVYNEILQKEDDRRWRIEHAQVVNQDDFKLFGSAKVIPSVQPTHATSDMYWAGDRLGAERVKGAYAFLDLLKQNGYIACGSDFPVEDINPLFGFYAAVERMDQKQWPAGGYQTENALSREQALRGMTLWAAYANFEEEEKGSLEKGKFADLVVLDQDIMTAPGESLYGIKVRKTFVHGELVFSSQ